MPYIPSGLGYLGSVDVLIGDRVDEMGNQGQIDALYSSKVIALKKVFYHRRLVSGVFEYWNNDDAPLLLYEDDEVVGEVLRRI